MKIEYELEGAGWAVAKITTGTQTVTMTVSYLNDSLSQLTDAAIKNWAAAQTKPLWFSLTNPASIN